MPLYRAIYYRQDKIRGITFWSGDAEAATSYAHDVVEKCTGVPVLTVVNVRSKLPERSDGRSSIHKKRWEVPYIPHQQQLQLKEQR